MKTKIYLLILCCFCTAIQTLAQKIDIEPYDTLRLEHLEKNSGLSNSITIGGRDIKINDIFKAHEKINWTSVKLIRVRNIRTDKTLILSQKKTPLTQDFYNEYIKLNHTGTKGTNNISEAIDYMKSKLSHSYYFVNCDTLRIGTALPVNKRQKFSLQPVSMQAEFSCIINLDEPHLIYITKEMLKNMGIDINKAPCTFFVRYISNEGTINISETFVLANY